MSDLSFSDKQAQYVEMVTERLFGDRVDCSPFGVTLYMPEYAECQRGEWEMKLTDDRPHKGYFNGICTTGMPEIPILTGGDEVWMGVTAREIESHYPHVFIANGLKRVAVMGLGMGYYPYLLAQHRVEEIYVFERDNDVINLFYDSVCGIDEWQEVLNKITIVRQDVLSESWQDYMEFDHCYTDIWLTMADENCIQDVAHIAERLPNCTNFSWWTQELTFVEWAVDRAMESGNPNIGWGETLWKEFTGSLPFRCDMGELDLNWYANVSKKAAERAYFD